MSSKVTSLYKQGKIGKPTDAKDPIYIHASKIDVYRGLAWAPDQCVLAKAALRAIPNSLKCIFYENAVYIAVVDIKTGKKTTLRYIPSPEAQKAIATYDMTGKFPTGRYRLDAPSGSNTLAAIKARNVWRNGTRHKEGNKTITRKPVDLKTECAVTPKSGRSKRSCKKTLRDEMSRRNEKQTPKRSRLQFAFA